MKGTPTIIFVHDHKHSTVEIPNRTVVRISYNANIDMFIVDSDDKRFVRSVPGNKLVGGDYRNFNEVMNKILVEDDPRLVVSIDNSARAEIDLILDPKLVLQFTAKHVYSRAEPYQHPTVRINYNKDDNVFRVVTSDQNSVYFVNRDELVGDFRNFGEVLSQILNRRDTPQVVSINSSARTEIDLIWNANIVLF